MSHSDSRRDVDAVGPPAADQQFVETGGSHSPVVTSRELRRILGGWMVDAAEWADEHRRSMLCAALLSVSTGVALLLKLHGLPGYSRITTQAQLAARLQRHQSASFAPSTRQLRLPVLLTGIQVQGGRLQVQVLHYPLLLRWADRYRGAHPSRHLPALHCCNLQGPGPAANNQQQQQQQQQWASSRCTELGGTQFNGGSCTAGGSSSGHSSSSSGDCGTSCSGSGSHAMAPRGTSVDHSNISSSSSMCTSQAPLDRHSCDAGLISCTVAGLQDVDISVPHLLQQQLAHSWCYSSSSSSSRHQAWPRVVQLRVFAVTDPQPPPSHDCPALAVQSEGGGRQGDAGTVSHLHSPPTRTHISHNDTTSSSTGSSSTGSSSTGSSSRGSSSTGSGSGVTEATADTSSSCCQQPPQQQAAGESHPTDSEVWIQLWVRGLQQAALQAAAARITADSGNGSSTATRHTMRTAPFGHSARGSNSGSPSIGSSSTGSSGTGSSSTGSSSSGSGSPSIGSSSAGSSSSGSDSPSIGSSGNAAAAGETTAAVAAGAAAAWAKQGRTGRAAWSWQQQRRRDVAEQLLRCGLGRLADPEDCEWLGVSQARWRAHVRAAEQAERWGLGLYASSHAGSTSGLLTRVWSAVRSFVSSNKAVKG